MAPFHRSSCTGLLTRFRLALSGTGCVLCHTTLQTKSRYEFRNTIWKNTIKFLLRHVGTAFSVDEQQGIIVYRHWKVLAGKERLACELWSDRSLLSWITHLLAHSDPVPTLKYSSVNPTDRLIKSDSGTLTGANRDQTGAVTSQT